MALFQVQLKEDTESIEVYCVLIVTDDGTCITFLSLGCSFSRDY